MTSQIDRAVSIVSWIGDNSKKIQSTLGAVALYLSGLEAAHPSKTVWEILTSGGMTSVLTIGAGILGALVSGWRTSNAQSNFQAALAAKKANKEYAKLPPLNEDGEEQ